MAAFLLWIWDQNRMDDEEEREDWTRGRDHPLLSETHRLFLQWQETVKQQDVKKEKIRIDSGRIRRWRRKKKRGSGEPREREAREISGDGWRASAANIGMNGPSKIWGVVMKSERKKRARSGTEWTEKSYSLSARRREERMARVKSLVLFLWSCAAGEQEAISPFLLTFRFSSTTNFRRRWL